MATPSAATPVLLDAASLSVRHAAGDPGRFQLDAVLLRFDFYGSPEDPLDAHTPVKVTCLRGSNRFKGIIIPVKINLTEHPSERKG
jgi:hypothetical protein